MSLVRWDPFRDLRPFWRLPFDLLEEDWVTSLPVDLYEEDNKIVVKADLPGFKPEEVEVEVTGDTVTISAERKEEKEEKNRNYYRRERTHQRLARTLALPAQVEAEQAEAQFSDGTLVLTLPKVAAEKPHKIKVKVK